MSQKNQTRTPQAGKSQKMEAAGSWGKLTWLREQLYGAATKLMFEAARLKPGDHVLDIAAGTGNQSRMAAKLVGPNGSVLAIDISEEALTVATHFAEQEDYSNITTRVANAEQLDLPENGFDAVISRFGLMLIGKQQQALAEIRRVLKLGGRLAAIVWSLAERNPLFAMYVDVIERPVEAKRLGFFSLADAAYFADVLKGADSRRCWCKRSPSISISPLLTCSEHTGVLCSRRHSQSSIPNKRKRF
jgi:ubiquinone/menaquinone biosynthesis C-methylase UbiE